MYYVGEIFYSHLPPLIFVHGLVYFIMALAIISRRWLPGVPLTQTLWQLAGFALVYSLAIWSNVLKFLQGLAGHKSGLVVMLLEALLVAVACTMLFSFGVNLLSRTWKKLYGMKLIPYITFLFWLTAFFLLPLALYPGSEIWVQQSMKYSIYFLGVTGSIVTALALMLQIPSFREMKSRLGVMGCWLGAVAFMAFAVVNPLKQIYGWKLSNPWVCLSQVGLGLVMVATVVILLKTLELEKRRQIAF